MPEERRKNNGRRGFSVRVISGFVVMFLLFFLTSFLSTHIITPVLGFWKPVFQYIFGDVGNNFWDAAPKFSGFMIFSLIATVFSAVIIDMIITSHYFEFLMRLLYKLPYVKQTLSFFQSSTNAYRNLKQARPVIVKIQDLHIPAFVTKERTFVIDGRAVTYLVLFCPHTPTFFSGNTFYIKKDGVDSVKIIDVPRVGLVEDIVSAGIFGKHD